MIRAGSLITVLCEIYVEVVLSTSFAHSRILAIPRAVSWLAIWGLRSHDDPSRWGDVVFFSLAGALNLYRPTLLLLREVTFFQICVLIALLIILLFALAGAPKKDGVVQDEATCPEEHPFDSPLFFPSRTTHTRMFPKKHSFAYSYLTVSIPVGFRGKVGKLLSVDTKRDRGWFHVQSSDYLERNGSLADLKSKLHHYLEKEGVSKHEWRYAYLVTAPRFLGYSFNPASFWYIYDRENVLTKMIVEVNNTFDERRMYLLDAKTAKAEDIDDHLISGETRFKHAWRKDFHVSPFNSRKGGYTLSADDSFPAGTHSPGPINITIVLKSSKDFAKLIARIFSVGDAVDPRSLNTIGSMRFLMRWWWVGFVTFPRIIREAAKLFFARSLHVWFRPEVMQSSIGRNATALETKLEAFFQRYLEDAVQNCVTSLQVSYSPSDGPLVTFRSAALANQEPESDQRLQIKVLTPAFYSRFIHYSHTSEAFDREALFTDDKNRTVFIANPQLLPVLFPSPQPSLVNAAQRSPGWADRIRWKAHKILRCPSAAPTYPEVLASSEMQVIDIRPPSLSPLDHFVQYSCPDAWIYRRRCALLFLANRFTFGIPAVVNAVDLGLRIVLYFYLTLPAVMISGLSAQSWVRLVMECSRHIASLNSLHIWSWIKGLS